MAELLVFGDSIFKGVMYNEKDNRYCLCNDNKFISLQRPDFTVLNKSKMGATINCGIKSLKINANKINSDTVVLLEYGGNDSNFNWKEISENPKGTFLSNTPIDKFVSKYTQAVKFVKKKGARVIISTLVPIDAAKFMSSITKGLNYENILSWLGDISMLYRWQEYYNHFVEKVAISLGVELLDIRNAFLLKHNYKNLFCADGIHPTQIGHDMIKQEIKKYLN